MCVNDQVFDGEETYNCLFAPDTITAFSAYVAYDEVKALDAYDDVNAVDAYDDVPAN